MIVGVGIICLCYLLLLLALPVMVIGALRAGHTGWFYNCTLWFCHQKPWCTAIMYTVHQLANWTFYNGWKRKWNDSLTLNGGQWSNKLPLLLTYLMLSFTNFLTPVTSTTTSNPCGLSSFNFFHCASRAFWSRSIYSSTVLISFEMSIMILAPLLAVMTTCDVPV